MGLAADDLAKFRACDPLDDEDVPLGDAFEELAIDVDTNAVEAVRDVRGRR